MKITGAVALALIAGILGSADSQSSESTQQSACLKNGGPDAWENLQIAKSNYSNCMISLERELEQGFVENVEMGPVLTMYCNKIQIFQGCIRNLMGPVSSCLEPDQRLLASRNLDATLLATNFPCSNRLLLTIVLAVTDKRCMSTKVHAVRRCGEELLFGNNSPDLVFSFNNQTCSNVRKFEQCTLSQFGACEPLVLSTVLNVLSSFLNSGLLCNDQPQASQGGLVTNILSPVTNQLLPGIL